MQGNAPQLLGGLVSRGRGLVSRGRGCARQRAAAPNSRLATQRQYLHFCASKSRVKQVNF